MQLAIISKIFEKNFFSFFIVLYISLATLPFFKAFGFYNYLMIGLLLSFIYLYFFIDNKWATSISLFSVLSFFTIFILFTLSIGSRNISTGLNYVIYVHIIFCYIMFNILIHQNLHNEISKKIVFVSLLVFLFTSLITFVALLNDPYVSRQAKIDEPYGISLAMKGIGGYSFIYSLSLMIIPMLSLSQISALFDKPTKLFLFCFFIISLATIILSNFFTAILVAGFGIWFYYFQQKPFLMISLVALLAIIAIISFELLSDALGFDNMNLIKLFEVVTVIGGGEVGDYGYGRLDRYVEGISGIIQYPFFGMINQGVNVIETYGYSQHSALLDFLSLYGIFIGTFAFVIFLLPFFLIRLKSKLIKKGYNSCMASYLIILALNVNTIDIMVTMFLIIPVFFKYMDDTIQRTYGH